MKIDREEDMCFFQVYVFTLHSANKGISMDSMQKSGQK